MLITLQNVCPAPIPVANLPQSEVWDADLRFLPDSTTIVSAESGKGKSTLINTILGIRHDYTGTVCIDGTDVKTMTLDQLAAIRKTRLSIVPQNLQLFENLSALDNILIKNNITHHHTPEHIHRMLQRLEIDDLASRPIGKMSYGQRQRVAIIRSLCQPFEFLLLDEPFSHLDSRTRDISWQLITEEATAQHAGIILTTLNPADFPTLPHVLL